MASGRTDRPTIPRWKKAAALIPLALLTGAWTANAGSSSTTARADSTDRGSDIPSVPTTAFDDPASYTKPGQTTFSGISSDGDQPTHDPTDPSSISANGIPAAAMAAYRRAEAVLDQADPSCHLSWALIAAIGRVESDHGRYGGNVLGSDGVATPGIFGLPLDGSAGTARITDTDGGAYDEDTVYDRAVGPMQFIPGTWNIVGVDADGDGQKNPQDIDDAALATGVYLCAGTQDLATTPGQRAAVFSYNHSDRYVDLVLAIMNAYLDGNFTEVADGLPISTSIAAKHRAEPRQPSDRSRHRAADDRRTTQRQSSTNDPGTTSPSDPDPDDPGSTDPGNDPGSDPGGGPDPSPTTSSPPTVPDPTETVDEVVLTAAQAKAMCVDKLSAFEPATTDKMITGCTEVLTGLSESEAESKLVGNTLAAVLTNLGLADLIPIDTSCLPLDCGD